MAKWRMILFGIMALSVVASTVVIQRGTDSDKVVIAIAVISPFFVTALLLFLATFCKLDAEGRVAKGTYLWKILQRLPREEMREVEGKKVLVKVPREQLKICPSYWWLLFVLVIGEGLLLISIGLWGVALGFVTRLVAGEIVFSREKAVTGALVLFVGVVLIGAIWILVKLNNRLLNTAAATVVIAGAIVGLGLVLLSGFAERGIDSASIVPFLVNKTNFHAVLFMLLTVGTGCVIFFTLLIFCTRVFPWLKNTALGRFIAALYGRLCPAISIAPAYGDTAPSP